MPYVAQRSSSNTATVIDIGGSGGNSSCKMCHVSYSNIFMTAITREQFFFFSHVVYRTAALNHTFRALESFVQLCVSLWVFFVCFVRKNTGTIQTEKFYSHSTNLTKIILIWPAVPAAGLAFETKTGRYVSASYCGYFKLFEFRYHSPVHMLSRSSLYQFK